jgi:hypothetical protein
MRSRFRYEPAIIPELMLQIECWFLEIGFADEPMSESIPSTVIFAASPGKTYDLVTYF